LGRKRRFGRSLDGVLLIDKEPGMTSNDVVQKAKRLFFASKAGHTGALDPLATGVLPICFGESTKFSRFLLNSDKSYLSTFCFGVTTDTADSDGTALQERDASSLTAAHIEQALGRYLGEISQIPPMYSALKKDGQPLYKLARQGKEVERAPRQVTVRKFKLLDFTPGISAMGEFLVNCSKGTYVRTLAEDLGNDLGVGAHVASLRRIKTGQFEVEQANSLSILENERGESRAEVLDHHLLAVDAAVSVLPKVVLDQDSGYYFMQGQAVMDTEVYQIAEEGDTVRVFRAEDEFLGLGEVTDDGRVTPKRLICS